MYVEITITTDCHTNLPPKQRVPLPAKTHTHLFHMVRFLFTFHKKFVFKMQLSHLAVIKTPNWTF